MRDDLTFAPMMVVTTVRRIAEDCDDVEGLVICLELVLRELIAQEHLR